MSRCRREPPLLRDTCHWTDPERELMTFFMLLPDEKIEHEDEEKNWEDSPGVHVNLLDLGETVAGRLLLRDGD